MFNKFAFGTLALAAMSTAALAADLPSRRMAPAYIPPPPLPVFTWTGAYIGINAGYAFDNRANFNTFDGTGNATGVAGGLRPATALVKSNGFTGGGQIGYNYQFGTGFGGGGIVIGAEADAAYTDLKKTNAFVLNGNESDLHSRLEYLGTVRGRIGYAFDRFMIYGTGGFAYGGVDTAANFFGPTGTFVYTGSSSRVQTGYTYGGGVEYALPTDSFLNFMQSSAVTVKVEYLHYDLGSTNLAVAAVAGNAQGATGAYTQRVKLDGNLVRAGLNFKFGSPIAPVVARY